MKYFFSKTVNLSFENAVQNVTEKLKERGFGIVSEIFVSEILKNKIGFELQPYKILGACSPLHAFKAITIEPHIGLMLPCNVVVRQIDVDLVEVSGIDPVASMMAIENPKLTDIALEVQNLLREVIENL